MGFEPHRRKLEETLIDILKSADLDTATELSVRKEAEKLIGIDLSDLPSKQLLRLIVESFLLPFSAADELREATEDVSEIHPEKSPVTDQNTSDDGVGRIICRLPGMRRASIKKFKETKLLSIREYYQKQGKVFPSGKGITLNPKEWTAFRSIFPDTEEAITKMESRMRGKECSGMKQTEIEVSNPSTILVSEADTHLSFHLIHSFPLQPLVSLGKITSAGDAKWSSFQIN